MSHRAEIKIEETKRKEFPAVCEECSRETVRTVLTNVSSRDASPDGDIQVWENYLTILCRGCKTVSFCRESYCSEDLGPDGEPIMTAALFPNRIARRPPLKNLYYLPRGLWKAYEETRSALMHDLPILTGIGIRAIVETVCNEKGCSSRNLEEKIGELISTGVITRADGAILHDLRFMGNEAAHKTKAHSQDELSLALDVAEHLLESVYLLPERAKRLPNQSRTATQTDADDEV